MSALLIFLLIAFVLLWALFTFLERDNSPGPEDTSSFPLPSGYPGSCDNREFSSLGQRVFSDRDWNFIQREQSPALNKLFVSERRAVIAHWLRESAARLRAVRVNHVQNSRHSANLDVLEEARLLFVFSYLGLLCWALLLIVRFSHPSAPNALAVHFQSLAGKLFASAPRVFAPAAPDHRTFSSS